MSTAPIVAWFGPINLTQAGEAKVPGATAINIPCTGDGNPTCGAIADSWRDADGRRLPAMLRSKQQDPNAEVILGAFSAGGQIAKRLGLDARDRAQIRAMMLSDAMYTSASDGAAGPNEGYVQYAVDAASDPSKLMVATSSSSPNKSYPTGSQTMALLKKRIEDVTGWPFERAEFPTSPSPVAAWRMGNVLFADYGSVVPHGGHALVIAPQIWKNILLPWMEGDRALPQEIPSHKTDSVDLLALLGATVIGYAGVRWLTRSTSRTRRGSIRL